MLARQTTSCGGVLGGVAPEAGCIVAELQAAQQAAQMPAGFPPPGAAEPRLTPSPDPLGMPLPAEPRLRSASVHAAVREP